MGGFCRERIGPESPSERCWDLEKQAWKSIILHAAIGFKPSQGHGVSIVH